MRLFHFGIIIHLSIIDQKVLTHFVRVCSILVSQIIEFDLMKEAYRRLIKIVKLIEEHYDRNKITPNLHLSLHLCECARDFGPLYAFWCFSFKRMNGILGNILLLVYILLVDKFLIVFDSNLF